MASIKAKSKPRASNTIPPTRSGSDFSFVSKSWKSDLSAINTQSSADTQTTDIVKGNGRKRSKTKARKTTAEKGNIRRSGRLAGQPAELQGLPNKQVGRKKPLPTRAPDVPRAADLKVASPGPKDHAHIHRVAKGRVSKNSCNVKETQPVREDLFEHTKRQCVACTDEVPLLQATTAPCSHAFCTRCFVILLRNAMNTEGNFPPQCCQQPISLTTIRKVVTKKLLAEYIHKQAEYSVPANERVYCYGEKCSAFIPQDKIKGGIARCGACKRQTCVFCRGCVHKGSCAEDEATEKVMQLARQEKWKACIKCGSLIQRTEGCKHMVCRCGAQFCYTCGVAWGRCNCLYYP